MTGFVKCTYTNGNYSLKLRPEAQQLREILACVPETTLPPPLPPKEA